jgi:hypothetical protein
VKTDDKAVEDTNLLEMAMGFRNASLEVGSALKNTRMTQDRSEKFYDIKSRPACLKRVCDNVNVHRGFGNIDLHEGRNRKY